MSERGIMLLVVAALFIGAFLFPYENDDSSYVRQTKPIVPQKPNAGTAGEAAGPRAVEVPASTDPKFNVALTGPVANRPAPEVVIRQVVATQGQIASQRNGFADGRWLEGTWVQVMDDPSAQPTRAAPTEPVSITFRVDGTFTEHMLLSQGDVSPSADEPRPDFEGRYRLAAFTLSISRTDRAVVDDPELANKVSYVACPLAGENAKGLPIRLFIDGKVLKYRE